MMQPYLTLEEVLAQPSETLGEYFVRIAQSANQLAQAYPDKFPDTQEIIATNRIVDPEYILLYLDPKEVDQKKEATKKKLETAITHLKLGEAASSLRTQIIRLSSSANSLTKKDILGFYAHYKRAQTEIVQQLSQEQNLRTISSSFNNESKQLLYASQFLDRMVDNLMTPKIEILLSIKTNIEILKKGYSADKLLDDDKKEAFLHVVKKMGESIKDIGLPLEADEILTELKLPTVAQIEAQFLLNNPKDQENQENISLNRNSIKNTLMLKGSKLKEKSLEDIKSLLDKLQGHADLSNKQIEVGVLPLIKKEYEEKLMAVLQHTQKKINNPSLVTRVFDNPLFVLKAERKNSFSDRMQERNQDILNTIKEIKTSTSLLGIKRALDTLESKNNMGHSSGSLKDTLINIKAGLAQLETPKQSGNHNKSFKNKG